MAENELESWPSRVGRVVMRAPGESWSALAAVPVYVCNFSESAIGAMRETAAAEHWARLAELPSTVVRHVNSAVWQSRSTGPGECVSRLATEASAAVSAGGSRLSGVGQESVARLALMIGALVPAKLVVPRVTWSEIGGSRQTGTPIEHVELNPPALPGARAQAQEEVEAGALSKATTSTASEGFGFLLRVASRWRGAEEKEAEPDLEPLQRAGELQDLRGEKNAGCAVPEFVPYFAQVPWHRGPRAFFSAFFPRYGNYCGPNWSSGRSNGSLSWDKAPIDHLDYCCYCHDIGYDSHDQRDLYRADLQLLRCLETMPERERWDKANSKLSIAGAYRVLCIIGLRSFLMPYRRALIRRIEAAENRQLFAPKRGDF